MAVVRELSGPLRQALDELGYPVQWLSYGFLSEAALLEQVSRFREGGDKNTEHYRYASFRALLRATRHPDGLFIARFIELAVADPDRAMAESVLGALCGHEGLSDQQLEALWGHPAFSGAALRRLVLRARLLRALNAGSLSPESFSVALESADRVVQAALLDRADLSIEQLRALSQRAATRALRNRSRERLSRRERRSPALKPD